MWDDVFISHATEDKELVARPLAKLTVLTFFDLWLGAER
jgi:hypothetical protein